jgi:putative transposase
MKKAALRIQLKIRSLVDDLHKKMVKWLCNSYRIIILPSFGTKGMVKRSTRKISASTTRAMLTWAHYRFKQRLLFKSQEYPWCKLWLIHPSHVVVVVNSIEQLERRKCLLWLHLRQRCEWCQKHTLKVPLLRIVSFNKGGEPTKSSKTAAVNWYF